MRLGTIKGSSLVKAVGFEGRPGDTATLRIRFDDSLIDFFKVPYRLFKRLVQSRDPGHYYLNNIYGKFDYKKLAA